MAHPKDFLSQRMGNKLLIQLLGYAQHRFFNMVADERVLNKRTLFNNIYKFKLTQH